MTIHRMTRTRTHKSWSEMRQRCMNANKQSYHRYGGRGIKICPEWNKFEQFYADMGERPVVRTLDRIDNDGDYTPENCRWATQSQQVRNTSFNRVIEFNGEKRCMSEWAEIYGLKPATLWRRLNDGDIPPHCFRKARPVNRIYSGRKRGNI